ncbi:MAG: GNAT family N-acetyltransferase [Candidatus Acidiferrales bacterium]
MKVAMHTVRSRQMLALDNPIWNSLTTLHARFAEGDALAKRFPPDVTTLAAMREPTVEAYSSLAQALKGSGAALFLDQHPAIPPGWTTIHASQILQMVCEKSEIEAEAEEEPAEVLTVADTDEMIALAELTKPGPFGKRTRELGHYIGIRESNRLAAMAGERLHLPGYTEVSAVCTHPDFQGRGFARLLISALMRRILQRGQIPILHVKQENVGAIHVYEKLGFRTRRLIHFVVLRPV